MATRLLLTYGAKDIEALIEKDVLNRGFELMVVRRRQTGCFQALVHSDLEVSDEAGTEIPGLAAFSADASERRGDG